MYTYDELAEELYKKAMALPEGRQYWLGVAGGPGSGKSTLAAELQMRIKQLCVIPLDGYHYYRNELDKMDDPVQAHIRRGSPFTFNVTKFIDDLIQARKSGEGVFPNFDHSIGDPVENAIQLLPNTKIVFVEGNYLLLNANPWCRLHQEILDETWYLNVSVQESNRRVVGRHMQIGMSEEQAWQRVTENDGLNAQRIANESPANADRILTVASSQ